MDPTGAEVVTSHDRNAVKVGRTQDDAVDPKAFLMNVSSNSRHAW